MPVPGNSLVAAMTRTVSPTRIGMAAMAALAAGVAPIPVRADGTKRPALERWKRYQTDLPTVGEVDGWFADPGVTGLAYVCGAVSGNLEVLDFDDAAAYDSFCAAAEAVGLGPLLDRIRAGYEERTPGGGTHLPYVCEQIAGSQKLARAADGAALIETKGSGGYVVAAPSNGRVHPDGGAWVLVSGGVESIAAVTPDERAALLALARTFDELPPVDRDAGPRPAPSGPAGGDRPGDAFAAKHRDLAAFAPLVERHGWKLVHRRGGVGYFRRPGKDHGWSATFDHGGHGYFYVFTSSATPFEPERGYTPFAVYALLEHGGDFAAAARALKAEGYGKRPVSLGQVVLSKRPNAQRAAAFEPDAIPGPAVSGWFRRYVDLVAPTTEAPDAFHVASALTFVGAMIGKRVGLFHASDELYANFYTLLIGPSGRSRKDTAIRRMRSLFYAPPPPGEPLVAVGMPFFMVRDISSSEGLIAMLRKQPNLLLYTSEFSKLMNNAARENTRSIAPTLIEAFDTPPSLQNNTVGGVEENEGRPREAKNPYVSVIATVQPEILAELIGGQHQYSGFLNRWLLVVGDGKGALPNPPNLDMAGAYRLIRDADTRIKAYPEGTLLGFDDEASDRWADWYVGAYPSGRESAQEDAMGIRRGTIVKKIALAHAVLDGADGVRLEHLERGIALGDWCWGHTRKLLPTWGETKDAELARKIAERLEHGPAKKRDLQRAVGNRLGPGVFARIVKAMEENGELATLDDGRVALRAD